MKRKRSPNALDFGFKSLDFDLESTDLDFKDVVLDLDLGNLDFGPILGFSANDCPIKGRKRRKKRK